MSKNPPPLRLLFWETTAGCNLECVHCRRLDVSHELMKNDMSTEQARGMIDDLAAFSSCILVFSGGEPLMRPDVFDLAAHARQKGLIIALASNGTMIDRAVASRIAETGFHRVSVSLDGSDSATHDRFRQLPGSFDRATGRIDTDGEPPGDPSRSGDQPASRTEDVLGSLAETVLLHGGDIVSLASTAMPCPTGAAAIYRY